MDDSLPRFLAGCLPSVDISGLHSPEIPLEIFFLPMASYSLESLSPDSNPNVSGAKAPVPGFQRPCLILTNQLKESVQLREMQLRF